MENHTHYFWAVRLPDATKQSVYTQLTTIKNFFPFKRWVHESDYHITLTFLGSADEEKIHFTEQLVGKAIKEVKAFPIQINGVDVFGNRRAPRIFWGAVNQESQLHGLQSYVFKACTEAGFLLEARPYTPHITLARNWNGADFGRESLEMHNPFKHISVSFMANEVVLYKTNIGQTPKYEPIATFSLLVE